MRSALFFYLEISTLIYSNSSQAQHRKAGTAPLTSVSNASIPKGPIEPALIWNAKDNPFDYTSTEANRIRNVEHGADALQTRLDMINNAKESIDIASFDLTFEDRGGRLLIQALMRKAKEGVKVQLSVDWHGSPENLYPPITRELAKTLTQAGIAVKYYNPASFFNPSQLNHRNHRKLFIVDHHEMILGGRNVSDTYWDLQTQNGFSYLDRDTLVSGPSARAAAESFDRHFSSNLSKTADESFSKITMDPTLLATSSARAKNVVTENAGDRELLKRIEITAKEQRERTHSYTTSKIRLISDKPGHYSDPKTRVVGKVLEDEIKKAKKSILIEAGYFIPSPETDAVIRDAVKRGVTVTVLANSDLTDADANVFFYSNESQRADVKEGVKVFGLKGDAPVNQSYIVGDKGKALYGTHAKTIVIDDQTVFNGSLNIDSRARNINAEDANIVYDNPDYARDVTVAIQARIAKAWAMDSDGHYIGRERTVVSAPTDSITDATDNKPDAPKKFTLPPIFKSQY